MSDARTATWAAPLPKNPCSVLGAHALFQLPPTSKHKQSQDGIASLFNHWSNSMPHPGRCPKASLVLVPKP